MLPSQTGTIYFIILIINVLFLKKTLFFVNDNVDSTANSTRIIYAHVTIPCVTRYQVRCER